MTTDQLGLIMESNNLCFVYFLSKIDSHISFNLMKGIKLTPLQLKVCVWMTILTYLYRINIQGLIALH